jgi:hypothetical protein
MMVKARGGCMDTEGVEKHECGSNGGKVHRD